MKPDDIVIHRTRNNAQVRHGRADGHERLDALRRRNTSTSNAWAWRWTA